MSNYVYKLNARPVNRVILIDTYSRCTNTECPHGKDGRPAVFATQLRYMSKTREVRTQPRCPKCRSGK